MAINANTVYQTVLLILNKEQRGYMTPLEFNKTSTQVQLEIFESYFEDLNQQLRMPENDTAYANRVKHIEEKISIFETSDNVSTLLPKDCHRVGTLVYYKPNSNTIIECQEVSVHEYNLMTRSPLTAPSTEFPIYYLSSQGTINVYPTGLNLLGNTRLNYIRKPKDIEWAYSVDSSNGAYIWAGQGSGQDFEIDDSEQTELILKILAYAGIIIKDPQIIQTASAMAQQQDQNEKS